MSETFNLDFRQGSLIEKYSKSKGVNVGNQITKQEKGNAYCSLQLNSGQITYPAADMTALNFGTGAFSVVCAFKMGEFINLGSGINMIFFNGWFSNSIGGVGVNFNSNQELSFSWDDGVTATQALTLDDFGDLYDGKYHLTILTFDGTTYKAFLDNVKETTESTTIKDITTSEDFYVSRDGNIGRRSNSDIAYIRAYDTALTQAERNELYTEFLHSYGTTEQKRNFVTLKPTDLSSEDGLVAAYNMIPSSGGVLTDISGEGNDGTITGALSTKDGMAFDGVDDSVDCSDDSSLDFGSGVFSVAVRAKNTSGGADHRALVSKGLYNDGWIFYIYDRELRFANHEDYTTLATTETYTDDLWHTFIVVREANDDGVLYVDGIEVKRAVDFFVGQDTDSTIKMMIGSENEGATKFFDGEMEDVKVYNSALSAQQAKDYNNSFIKPVIIETFADSGADGIVKTPREWIKGTGDYKVEEGIINFGEQTTKGKAMTSTDWDVTAGTTFSSGTAIYDGTTNGSTLSQSTAKCIIYPNRGYDLTFTVTGSPRLAIFNEALSSPYATIANYSAGTHTINFTGGATGGIKFLLYSAGTGTTISNISIKPFKDEYTKYLENTTPGTIATQSKQAYGEWEFDVNKGDDGNDASAYFIGDSSDTTSIDGYRTQLASNEKIYFRRMTNNATSDGFETANSYIDINTWYRLKVARLASEGVFKDIPTLQTSDLVNSVGANAYTTFTSNGRYGFSVTSDGSASHRAGTAIEIPITNTAKYLIEYDLTLNSGTAPIARLRATSFAGADASNSATSVNGKNSFILTATTTSSNCGLVIYNISTATDYKVSGLTIRRIYDADDFAVFISGGSFGEQYTLVDTAGGSGTNPIGDSTYTTSRFFVSDLDAADAVTNLRLKDGVPQ